MAHERTKGRIVYSTDGGRHCPTCGKVQTACQCKSSSAATPSDGIVRLQRQSKGRAGKPVIIITGLGLSDTALKPLAKQLKTKCGVGGTIDAGNIIIQGDKRDAVKAELESLGYTVKLSGG